MADFLASPWLVDFTLEGTTPCLMHADDIEQSDELQVWRKDPRNKNRSVPGDDRSPPWSWQTSLYSDGERLTIPADVITANLIAAAARVVLKGAKTYKELVSQGVVIPSMYCEFLSNGEQVPVDWIHRLREEDLDFPEHVQACKEHGFRLFMKRAKVGATKHVRVRARFDQWSVKGSMEVRVRELSAELLEQFFSIGGGLGILDWRPSSPRKPGPYGMYRAVLKRRKG